MIREKEDALFEEWRTERPDRIPFISDGMVSEEYYKGSTPKIVVILREVNGWEDGDLRDYLKAGANGGGNTWNRVAEWVCGIRHRADRPAYGDIPDMSSLENRAKELQNICAVNLKKSSGVETVVWKELGDAALEDSDFIKRQYALYDPDITICGGTLELFQDVVGHGNIDLQSTKVGQKWYTRSTGKYVIGSYHPAARPKNKEMFEWMMASVKEIYQ